MSLNKCILQGRLTKDPEIRFTSDNKPVASFALAVDRDYNRQQVDFINCVAWEKTAEFMQKYFHKGDMAIVEGRVQVRSYTTTDAVKRTATEIKIDHVYFGGSKKSDAAAEAPATFEELPPDGDLPF